MKVLVVFLLGIVQTTSIYSQSVSEKVARHACAYLDSINNFDHLEDTIQRSISRGMAKVMMDGSLEERKQISNVEGIRAVFKEAFEILPRSCYNIRRLVIEQKKSEFYRMSDDPLANEHYNSGSLHLESGDTKKAIKEFNAAIRSDKNFVYAIDHLAISYRRQDDFKTAIKFYQQSLEIFPEGDVALLNIAVAYSFLHDDDNALRYYEQLRFLYPNDPEGYFGAAKILFLKSEYDDALDNLFFAHRLYVDVKSEYGKDSERLITTIFSKLKEINRTDIFEKKAKAHNIEVDVDSTAGD